MSPNLRAISRTITTCSFIIICMFIGTYIPTVMILSLVPSLVIVGVIIVSIYIMYSIYLVQEVSTDRENRIKSR